MKFPTVASLFAFAFATGTEALLAGRQTEGCTCGIFPFDNHYTSTEVINAINHAESSGAGTYPRQYKNLEGFSLPSCNGEFFQYPLKVGHPYDGGPPGADRVIYDENGDFCACITHTGALVNGFVECDF